MLKNALNMYVEWIATEYHRLHIIEEWPEGPRNKVALAAIHSCVTQPVAKPPTRRTIGDMRGLLEPEEGDRQTRILRAFDLK